MMWREKNVLFVTTDSGRQMVASTNRKRAYRSINKAKTRKFSVMFSLSKHLAEACLNNGTNPTLAEEKINNSNTLPRGIRKNSFPRDSSATLGMTENKTLGMTHHTVMLSKRSASKHLAEALIE